MIGQWKGKVGLEVLKSLGRGEEKEREEEDRGRGGSPEKPQAARDLPAGNGVV